MAGGGGIYNNPTSLIDSPDGGPVSGTENPLWIDQKYKTYEEQELTMTIFSDQVSLFIEVHFILTTKIHSFLKQCFFTL